MPVLAASPAAAVTNFTAKTDLNGRDGPSLNADTVKVGMYLKGHTVPVACQACGEEAYGSAIWDRTTDGVWVPDFYVRTGSDGFAPGVPRCGDTSPDSSSFPATADRDGAGVGSPAARRSPVGRRRLGKVTCPTGLSMLIAAAPAHVVTPPSPARSLDHPGCEVVLGAGVPVSCWWLLRSGACAGRSSPRC